MSTAPHDVVVIGSGCTGGAAARQLTMQGRRALVLEAGDHVASADSHPASSPGLNLRRLWRVLVSKRQPTQSLHPGYWLHRPELFVDDRRQPYGTPADQPFVWIRGRQVGGRSLTWTGVSLRLSRYEMQGWPITYEDLAPYYDEIEALLAVCGTREGLEQLPDGVFRPGQPLTPAETAFGARIEARWKDRRLIVSRGIDPATDADAWSPKTSVGSTLAAAARTGLLEIRPNSIARRIVVDERTGRASGVEIVDRRSLRSVVIPARSVVVCASSLESVRLLLNSTSSAHPAGLGNSSGLLGRYILNKVSRSVTFSLPVEHADTVHPLSSAQSFLIPRYDTSPASGPGFGVWGNIQRLGAPALLRADGRALGMLLGYGECEPHPENQLRLDPAAVDAWGVPTPWIDVRWRESDRRLAERIHASLTEMVEAGGGALVPPAQRADPLTRHLIGRVVKASSQPGTFVHEMGGARMGTSPATSVVDPACRLWDADNVYVTDGACWPTSGWQNPTLTMMAITSRSCAILAERLARGEL